MDGDWNQSFITLAPLFKHYEMNKHLKYCEDRFQEEIRSWHEDDFCLESIDTTLQILKMAVRYDIIDTREKAESAIGRFFPTVNCFAEK